MPESFGARLRQRREEQGIALVTVAERTKIKQALLEALERDDVCQWPTGFYRRAFIRAYAQAIDLDPDAVLREFLELYPEPPAVDVLVAMATTLERANGGSRPGSGIRTVVGSAIGSLARLRRATLGEEPPNTEPPRETCVASVSSPNSSVETGTPLRHATPETVPLVTTPLTQPAADEPAPVAKTADQAKPIAITGNTDAVTDSAPALAAPVITPDLEGVARLCTALGRARDEFELNSLLDEVARVLDATGLIVWHWDTASAHLRPTLVYGYPPRVVAQLPALRPSADNATATAFRTGRASVVGDGPNAKSALVVPLINPEGCGGVLAIELKRGGEQSKSTLAIATIIAAVLAQSQLAPADDVSTRDRHYAREEFAG